MTAPDKAAAVAAILCPPPDPSSNEPHHVLIEMEEQLREQREAIAGNLRLAEDEGQQDPVISALVAARRRRDRADAEIRHLIAYGREFVGPRPYTLGQLAAAGGLSVSGTRTVYTDQDVARVAQVTGLRRPSRASGRSVSNPTE